jgi:tRNA(Ile)-lysidine synthase
MSTSLDTNAIFKSLDALQSRFGDSFVIGLSGGGDSLALAHFCAAWRKSSGAKVTALCIDHGFRTTSAAEASQAATWARELGLGAQVVTNIVPAPKTGLQEFARDLRLKAYAKAAHEADGATILLGHTRDDQAETIAFRLARQTGLDGLAGMAEVTSGLAIWQGKSYPIARPLLRVSRAQLRDYLIERGQSWIEDPSNDNINFGRVKIRQRLAVLGQSSRLAHIGTLARSLRDTIDGYADQFEHLFNDDGKLDAAAFLTAPPVLQARIVQRHLVALADRQQPIAPHKIDALLTKMQTTAFAGATLGGAKITRKGHEFHFTKAPARRKSKPKQSGT